MVENTNPTDLEDGDQLLTVTRETSRGGHEPPPEVNDRPDQNVAYDEVVSREQLLRDVWGYSQLSVTRTVDNYVAKLRTQLEPKPHEPRYIVTVHGTGYQLLV